MRSLDIDLIIAGGVACGSVIHTEKARDILHLDLELLVLGHVEKGFALCDDILYYRFGDASVGDVEEADSEKGFSQRSKEGRLC